LNANHPVSFNFIAFKFMDHAKAFIHHVVVSSLYIDDGADDRAT